jgi:hypothetical protein
MNAERIEELRERARLTLDSIDDDEEPELWLFYSDVLSLLDEKAAQLKAGVTVGAEEGPGPSPELKRVVDHIVSDADERALETVIDACYEACCHKYHPNEKEWWAMVESALTHLRSRLAKPAPLTKTREDMCFKAGEAEAELERLKDDLLDAQGDAASNMAQADSFAKLYGESQAELGKAKAIVLEAHDELAEEVWECPRCGHSEPTSNMDVMELILKPAALKFREGEGR